MQHRVWIPILGLLALAACDPASNPFGANSATTGQAIETPPDMQLVAEAMNDRAGSNIGDQLTLLSARAEENRLVLELKHDEDSIFFTPAQRDQFNFTLDQNFRTQMCTTPSIQRFIEDEGGVEVNIVTADDQPLANRRITECA